MALNIDDFNQEVKCVYKGECYSVRDNGAVMRHARAEGRVRPSDNLWTFGSLNKNGYCQIASEVVHRIVAVAFYGEPPTPQHVVDHKDTNSQNNRPENLRWVTRLENILLNPITVKNIIYACGSIEAFLADPSILRGNDKDINFQWMRRVTIEEADICMKRMLEWAQSDKLPSGGSLTEWIFNRGTIIKEQIELPIYIDSLTPNAVQENWKTPCEFPCCPDNRGSMLISKYAENLKIDSVFSRNQYAEFLVTNYAITNDNNTLLVICKSGADFAIKPWTLAMITYQNNLFIHKSIGSFFTDTGAEKQFTILQGLEWTGGESVDDYC